MPALAVNILMATGRPHERVRKHGAKAAAAQAHGCVDGNVVRGPLYVLRGHVCPDGLAEGHVGHQRGGQHGRARLRAGGIYQQGLHSNHALVRGPVAARRT